MLLSHTHRKLRSSSKPKECRCSELNSPRKKNVCKKLREFISSLVTSRNTARSKWSWETMRTPSQSRPKYLCATGKSASTPTSCFSRTKLMANNKFNQVTREWILSKSLWTTLSLPVTSTVLHLCLTQTNKLKQRKQSDIWRCQGVTRLNLSSKGTRWSTIREISMPVTE